MVDPPDIAGLMLEADLAVASASTSFWELACLGVPALLVVTADNQRAVARAARTRAPRLSWERAIVLIRATSPPQLPHLQPIRSAGNG